LRERGTSKRKRGLDKLLTLASGCSPLRDGTLATRDFIRRIRKLLVGLSLFNWATASFAASFCGACLAKMLSRSIRRVSYISHLIQDQNPCLAISSCLR